MDLGRSAFAVMFLVVGLATAAQAAKKPPVAPPGVTATFTITPASPQTGQSVTFRSTSQATGTGNKITKQEWDLDGNGSFDATGATVTRSYPTRRTIEVKLLVTDASTPSKTDVATRKLTVADRPPVASFGWSPAAPRQNDPVTFSSTSTDPDGTLADLTWDLNGDGNFDNGAGPSAMRSFSAPGSYVIGLRATDNDGQASFSSQTITIAPATPVVGQNSQSPRLMSPFPLVRVAGRILRDGAAIKLLVVHAPSGAKVSIRCSGRGCPFVKSVRMAGRVRVRGLERRLRAGVIVRVFVTKRGTIGKYTRIRIRGGKPPARADRCLPPSSWTPMKCPAG